LFFLTSEDRKTEHILSWEVLPVEGEGEGERVWDGKCVCKYCVPIYVNGKRYLLKVFQEWGRGEGEWWRG
jgi:hypothetical protein